MPTWAPCPVAQAAGAGDTNVEEVYPAGCADMLHEAAKVWPAINDWNVSSIRSGVRALPPRSQAGEVLYLRQADRIGLVSM